MYAPAAGGMTVFAKGDFGALLSFLSRRRALIFGIKKVARALLYGIIVTFYKIIGSWRFYSGQDFAP